MIANAKTGPAMTFDGVRRRRSSRYSRYLDLSSERRRRQAQQPEAEIEKYSTHSVCACPPLLPTPSHLLLLVLQAAQQTSLSMSILPSLESSLAVIKAHPYCRIPTANHTCATSAHIASPEPSALPHCIRGVRLPHLPTNCIQISSDSTPSLPFFAL